ncbi:hypothetical protein FH608_000770 [Nonomuraea phyllanthi]|uniref:Uncharacterized protein n=1 Tax=Nonomuraea phyllanthi TaxID=2219224 RepID=A0A5C4WU59_9ACTN|nr:LxmA leader domain family RiPP [Nonomuraea phyllanthi]KAB8197139.1 hypothetical protein FH608_000770 [Nonomuraea phyllanthi]QFY06858.1 hypothetical protein GBF35_09270 [Nonomuraea phyllanthi]
MSTSSQLMAGYAAYTTPSEVAASATTEAPAISPVSVAISAFATASSVECAVFSVGLVASGVSGWTIGAGC